MVRDGAQRSNRQVPVRAESRFGPQPFESLLRSAIVTLSRRAFDSGYLAPMPLRLS